VASAAAFAPAQTGQTVSALSAEKSPAMPFLPYPKNLKGYIGDDIGFDPLGISDYFPMDYLREAELKNGRCVHMKVRCSILIHHFLCLIILNKLLYSLDWPC
jgi:light-harvesting complex I chlorophyll a/b binding protein 1